MKKRYKITIGASALVLIAVAAFLIFPLNGRCNAPDMAVYAASAGDYAAVSDDDDYANGHTDEYAYNGEHEDDDGIVFVAQTMRRPAPREVTLQNKLDALLAYAQNRLDAAAPYGQNVRTGRWHPIDIEAFELAIHAVQESDADIQVRIDVLQAAIERFRDNIIDPYNRYRPYLATIAAGEDSTEKYHMRAVWIATVLNIDWPSVPARGTTPYHVDRQKYELRRRFDEIAELNMNAVIFQISPTADAFFNSEIVPWSAWLTGETNFTGELLDSDGYAFDPLQFAIDLARERNIEFHAWFNPYRITHSQVAYTRGQGIILSSTGERVTSLDEIRAEWSTIPGNPFNTMGEHIHLGEGRYVLDPGVPAAREWIVRRVLEVVENYDIDAVHFDDYFYPSRWNDDVVFARYGGDFPDTPQGRANFRRHNTEMLIIEVGQAIREVAPWVQFGISPGGVWISGDGTTGYDGGGWSATTGSGSTTSWSNYHSSFADTRRWVIENYIDYITPQIYWDWSLPAAPYGPIADWWSRLLHDFGPDGDLRNSHGEYTNARLYIGLGLYRMAENPPVKWRNAAGYQHEGQRTFLRQEHYNIGNPGIMGSMIFTHNHIRPYRENGMWETMSSLRLGAWRYPAFVPAITHLGGIAPAAPVNVAVQDGYITWRNAEESDSELVRPRAFVIYRARGPYVNMSNPAHIYAIVPAVAGQTEYKFPLSIGDYSEYSFLVTAMNRHHQESPIPFADELALDYLEASPNWLRLDDVFTLIEGFEEQGYGFFTGLGFDEARNTATASAGGRFRWDIATAVADDEIFVLRADIRHLFEINGVTLD